MKARLFVVDEETKKRTIEKMEVSIYVPEPADANTGKVKKQWNKTIIDIVSDLMQVEIGDYVYLWEKGTARIFGVFRALSRPYYQKDNNRNDIFKIKIGYAYEFKNSINEYDVINNPYMKNKLWNIIGKKVAGKSRGTSPITQEESQFLIQSLIDKNADYIFNITYNRISVDNELTFDFKTDFNGNIPRCLSDYEYEPFKVRENKCVHYEKALEGILNYLIREKEKSILKQLGVELDNINWYANYLPYGIEGTEIDYMIMESDDGVNTTKITVFELMRNTIDEDHINRCLLYSKWVKNSIANDNKIVRPALLCSKKSIRSKKGFRNIVIQKAISRFPRKYGFEGIDIYTYSMEDDKVVFEKYTGEK